MKKLILSFLVIIFFFAFIDNLQAQKLTGTNIQNGKSCGTEVTVYNNTSNKTITSIEVVCGGSTHTFNNLSVQPNSSYFCGDFSCGWSDLSVTVIHDKQYKSIYATGAIRAYWYSTIKACTSLCCYVYGGTVTFTIPNPCGQANIYSDDIPCD